jgi:hypothetical protein
MASESTKNRFDAVSRAQVVDSDFKQRANFPLPASLAPTEKNSARENIGITYFSFMQFKSD